MSALWCTRTTFKRTCQNLSIRVLGKVSNVIIMGERVEANQQNEVVFFFNNMKTHDPDDLCDHNLMGYFQSFIPSSTQTCIWTKILDPTQVFPAPLTQKYKLKYVAMHFVFTFLKEWVILKSSLNSSTVL